MSDKTWQIWFVLSVILFMALATFFMCADLSQIQRNMPLMGVTIFIIANLLACVIAGSVESSTND